MTRGAPPLRHSSSSSHRAGGGGGASSSAERAARMRADDVAMAPRARETARGTEQKVPSARSVIQ
eukprot:30836-Pelagococcus_subviridis.AAC.2